jgi:hypothetical protein
VTLTPGTPIVPQSIRVVFGQDDEPFARTLSDVLTSIGLDVAPVGHVDESHPSETDWSRSQACDAVVVIVGDDSARSGDSRKLLASAAGQIGSGGRLVAVMRNGAAPETLRSTLERAMSGPDMAQVSRDIIEFSGDDDSIPIRRLAQALGVDTRLDVFVSYARHERAFVDVLGQGLAAAGKRAWIDRHDLKPSDLWMKAIESAIEAADNFLFVITPESVASTFCIREPRRRSAMIPRNSPRPFGSWPSRGLHSATCTAAARPLSAVRAMRTVYAPTRPF